MKLNDFRKEIFSTATCFALLVTAFATQAEASTGFVANSYSYDFPYGFVWSNTNSMPSDATTSTHGMFNFNYDFISGSDWRVELGKPTTYNGSVDIDVFNANVRADKNTSLSPPQYGIFSGEFMTSATNPFFSQPVNPNFWFVNTTQSSEGLPIYDTLQQGINSQQNFLGQQTQITINSSGTGGFLPPTSLN